MKAKVPRVHRSQAALVPLRFEFYLYMTRCLKQQRYEAGFINFTWKVHSTRTDPRYEQ